MNVVIQVCNKNITVRLKVHAIKIFNDDELKGLLQYKIEASTDALIILIKKEYIELFNADFKVSNASMAIEIWAHVYVEFFFEVIKSWLSFKLINKIADKIIGHCKEIDIGEPGHDYNRFVWNGLVVFKPLIVNLFFKRK